MNYEKKVYVKCNLCGENHTNEISNRVQFEMPYKVVMCKNCGLMYINPVPCKEELNNFYIHKYESYYGIPAQYGDSNFKVRGYEIYDFLKGNVKTAEKILEIGAGGGGNILGLSEKYNSEEIAVFEPGRASNKSLDALGIQKIGEFYDEEIIDLKRFDFVVLSHVLEHFYEPKEVLSKIWNETAESVNLYIAIPSLSAINKKTYGYSSKMEEYWLRIVHLTYFHEKNIEDMLRVSGWRIKRKKKKNGELFILSEKTSKLDKEVSVQNVYEEHLNEVSYYKNMTNYLDLSKSYDREEKRVILFGSSKYGEQAYVNLKDRYDIICFCDNDSSKWGKKIYGIEIIDPNLICAIEFDYVIITSEYFREIGKQLFELGINQVKRIVIT